MRIIVVTKNGTTLKSKELTEDDVTPTDLAVYADFAKKAGNSDITGSIQLPLVYRNTTAIININNVDHVLIVDALYQEG